MSKVMDVKEKDGKFYAYYLNLKKKGKKNCDFLSVEKKILFLQDGTYISCD